MSSALGVIAAPGQTPGQRIGGIVGAVAGAVVGGPAGAFYGYQIGAEVSGALDPELEHLDAGSSHLREGREPL